MKKGKRKEGARAASFKDFQMSSCREIFATTLRVSIEIFSSLGIKIYWLQLASTATWLMFNEQGTASDSLWRRRYAVYIILRYIFSHMIVHMLGILSWIAGKFFSFPSTDSLCEKSHVRELRDLEASTNNERHNRFHLLRLVVVAHGMKMISIRWRSSSWGEEILELIDYVDRLIWNWK